MNSPDSPPPMPEEIQAAINSFVLTSLSYVHAKTNEAAQWRCAVKEADTNLDLAIRRALAGAGQPTQEPDKERLDWMEERGVDKVYFRDGTEINPGIMRFRDALDGVAAGLSASPSPHPDALQSAGKSVEGTAERIERNLREAYAIRDQLSAAPSSHPDALAALKRITSPLRGSYIKKYRDDVALIRAALSGQKED